MRVRCINWAKIKKEEGQIRVTDQSKMQKDVVWNRSLECWRNFVQIWVMDFFQYVAIAIAKGNVDKKKSDNKKADIEKFD